MREKFAKTLKYMCEKAFFVLKGSSPPGKNNNKNPGNVDK
jgi:hypothetical protein